MTSVLLCLALAYPGVCHSSWSFLNFGDKEPQSCSFIDFLKRSSNCNCLDVLKVDKLKNHLLANPPSAQMDLQLLHSLHVFDFKKQRPCNLCPAVPVFSVETSRESWEAPVLSWPPLQIHLFLS